MRRNTLRFLTTSHYIILGLNVLAFFVLMFNQPWYVWIPINTFLCNHAFAVCPLTWLENKYKRKLGMKTYPTFKEYLINRWIG